MPLFSPLFIYGFEPKALCVSYESTFDPCEVLSDVMFEVAVRLRHARGNNITRALIMHPAAVQR